jgi:excisionase family DNA binding protein
VPISMTMKQASEESGLGVRTLYELIQEGKLKSTTVGRRRLVNAQSLTELVTRGARRAKKARKPRTAAMGA